MLALQTPLDELRNLTGSEFEDFLLTKFLKARDNNVQKAFTMISNYKTWRKTENIENIGDFRFPEYHHVHGIYPKIWHKTDKLGRPVWIKHHATFNVEQLLKVSTHERFVKHHIRENEKLQKYRFEACSVARGERVSQVVLIMDLKGFSLLEVARALSILKEVAQIDGDYYPEMLGKIMVINASMFFSTVWGIIKGFCISHPRRSSKRNCREGDNPWGRIL
jgi:CRAL/TRIO domain/CRAL/TRIO, N-terminal domain